VEPKLSVSYFQSVWMRPKCLSPLVQPHVIFLSMKTRMVSRGCPDSYRVGLGLGCSRLCSGRGALDHSVPNPKQALELLFYESVLLRFLCWEGIWGLKPDQKEVPQHSWAVLSSTVPKAVPCWPVRVWFFVSKSSGLHGEAG